MWHSGDVTFCAKNDENGANSRRMRRTTPIMTTSLFESADCIALHLARNHLTATKSPHFDGPWPAIVGTCKQNNAHMNNENKNQHIYQKKNLFWFTISRIGGLRECVRCACICIWPNGRCRHPATITDNFRIFNNDCDEAWMLFSFYLILLLFYSDF